MASNAKNLAELLNQDSTVAVGDIADGSVTTAKLAADAVTAAKLADNAVVTANVSDGAITQAKTTGVGRGKNHFINGDFSVAQRATSASSGNGTYVSLDRWKTWAASAATVFSQQSFTLGQTDVPQMRHYARAVVSANSASGAYSTINQHIENVTLSSSQQMTLSFYAKASSNGLKIGIEPIQNFGTGGSPSSRVLIAGTAKTLTTSWARYTHTFTFGSISGKTLGTHSDNFEIGFWLSGGSDYNARTGSIGNQAGTFEIAGVQLENGATATDFEHLGLGEMEHRCQRYFYRNDDSSHYLQSMGPSAAGDFYVNYPIPIRMRRQPSWTATLGSDVSGCNAITINSRGNNNGYGVFTKTSTANNGYCSYNVVTASAEL